MFQKALIFTLLALLTSCSLAAREPEPPSTVEALPMASDAAPTSTAEPTLVGDPGERTFTVQRGTVTAEVVLGGQVRMVEVGVSFAKSGSVASVLVEVGERVSEGQLLAQLSGADMEEQLIQARADYNQANAALQQAVAAAQVDIRRAQLGVEEARLQLEDAKRPAFPHEITNARALLQQAEATLSTVRNTSSAAKHNAFEEMNTALVFLEVAQQRYSDAVLEFEDSDKEPEDREDLDQMREELRQAEDRLARARIAYETAMGNEVAAVQNAEAAVMNAQGQVERLLAGPDPIAIAEAERGVRLAEVGVQEASLGLRPDPLLSRSVRLAENQIRTLERELESRQLYAPVAGTIVNIDLTRGGAVLNDAPVVSIASNDQREIVTDAISGNPSLMLGQQVELVFTRYPGQRLVGTITSVPARPRDTLGGTPVAQGYTISFAAGDRRFDIGDRVEVRRELGRAEGALWLPPAAVERSGDQPLVMLRDSGGDRTVEVVLGLTNVTRVEILSGLSEGDVVVAPQRP